MSRSPLYKVGAALAAAAVAGSLATTTVTAAGGNAANKFGAAGAAPEVFPEDTVVTLLSSTVKSSNNIDYVIQFTAECSIITDVTTSNTGTSFDSQRAEGSIDVWVEIDGTPVQVAGGAGAEVTLCNRVHQQDMTFDNPEDEDDAPDSITLRTYQKTKAANGFNWWAIDVPHGHHTIEVKALLTTDLSAGDGLSVNPDNAAEAVVGNRTLVIEPVHLPPGSSI